MPAKRTPKIPRDSGNLPQLQQERVQACVYEEFSVASADAETLLNGGKQTLTNAIPSIEMHVSQGQKVVANDKGLTILERLDQLGTDVRDLRGELRDTQAELRDTQSQLRDTQAELRDTQAELRDTQAELRDTQSQLRSVQRVFYDTRERTYLTYLRDFWNEFGTPRYLGAKKTPLHTLVAQRVNMLNSGRIHAGDSESDAAMFTARQPFDSDIAFRYLYGLSAPEINEIVSYGHHWIIRALDSAGTVHYQGRHMAPDEQAPFDEIIEHVRQRRFVEAEKAAEAAIGDGKFSAGYMQEGEEDM